MFILEESVGMGSRKAFLLLCLSVIVVTYGGPMNVCIISVF